MAFGWALFSYVYHATLITRIVGSLVVTKGRQQLATVVSCTSADEIVIQYFNSTITEVVKPFQLEMYTKQTEGVLNNPVFADYI